MKFNQGINLDVSGNQGLGVGLDGGQSIDGEELGVGLGCVVEHGVLQAALFERMQKLQGGYVYVCAPSQIGLCASM